MAGDAFLKLDGVTGESNDSKHKGEIDVEVFSFGVVQTGTSAFGGGGGAGKAAFENFSVTKRADKSSPILMLKCATGEHIKSAVLTVRKAGGQQVEYYKIKFTDLLVSSFHNSGSGHDDIPMETLSLNYAKIEFEYAPQNADGTLAGPSKAGYNVKENVKV
jgi:type VI secretion system secreted protein Hcp